MLNCLKENEWDGIGGRVMLVGKSIGWWGRRCVQIFCAAAVGAMGVFAAPCASVALLSVQLAQQFEVDGLQAAASLGNLRSYSVHVVEHL